MKNINNLKFKKYAFYTLGVGLLLLGATNAAKPSERTMTKSPSEQPADPSLTTAEKTTSNQADTKAVNSLSPKHKSLFHKLPKSDQQRVIKAQQKNNGGHAEIQKILKEDGKNGTQDASPSQAVSPAQKSMEKAGN